MKSKLDKFFEEFDEDLDRLYQEEVGYLLNKKPKKRLKYPQSFYDYWKKKLKDLVMYYEGKGYQDGLKNSQKGEELSK